MNVEEDEAGRLAGFRARFGKSFDAGSSTGAGPGMTARTTDESDAPASEGKAAKVEKTKSKSKTSENDLAGMFGEDDEALLEMISNFGKIDKGSAAQIARKKI